MPTQATFRLQPWSPAIDAGDPASDASTEPESSGRRIDVGAFGNTSQAGTPSPDVDGDSLPDAWEQEWFGGLGQTAAGDPDGDGIVNLTEFRYGWDPTRGCGDASPESQPREVVPNDSDGSGRVGEGRSDRGRARPVSGRTSISRGGT